MKFNKASVRSCSCVGKIASISTEWVMNRLVSSPAENSSGILVDKKLDMSRQRALAARGPAVSWAA